jgi:hypothetical protein
MVGSGGVIRNYSGLNYREIFFDRTKAGGKTSWNTPFDPAQMNVEG